MTTFALDFDDASTMYCNWDMLLRLKDRYPKMKVTMFFIPFDYTTEKSLQYVLREQGLSKWKENLDWITLVPHGLTHMPQEFMNCDRETMEMSIKAIEEAMKRDGFPYEKGFKAPQWLYTQDVVDVLDEHGWWLGVDRNQPNAPRTKKFYEYNWSIDENFMDAKDEVIKLHGHMTNDSPNNLADCFMNLCRIPLNSDWVEVKDLIQTK